MTRKPLERLTDEELEGMLLEATSDGTPGRVALARVTAIRTILSRRAPARADRAKLDAERALEIVNAVRGTDRQLTEIHPTWVGSILADEAWAELYASDEELGMSGDSGNVEVGDDDD